MGATSTSTLGQLLRFGVVGLASNGILYVLYLFMTMQGLGPKLAMSIAYGIGVAQTFLFNRRWTFRHDGSLSAAFVRYCATYGIGYLANLTALVVLVDGLGWPHEWTQGAMILCIAALVFVLQKFWVFRADSAAAWASPVK